MRVLAITPIHVGAAELARRQRRYDRLAPAGVSVELVDLPAEAPRRLESAGDVERSDALVGAAAQAADPERHDAVLPDCVLDPGLDAGGPVINGCSAVDVARVGSLRVVDPTALALRLLGIAP